MLKQFQVTLISFITLVLLILFLMPAIANARIIYVDASRPDDNGDGLSWQTAKKYLQSALALANSGDELWVAQGTYYPDEGAGQTDNNRNSTFQLKDDVSIYGGFIGGETSRDQRDWENNPTILSGDLDQSGGKTDNDAYHVATGANNTVLDGFTITGGMYNEGSSPTVTNCTFSNNSAPSIGGGMYNSYSSPTVTNCIFSQNSAYNGGGMYNSYSSPTVTNCTFSSKPGGNGGGGMYNSYSSPMVTNCTFSSNLAYTDSGGGMYNRQSSPTVTNCTFSQNSAYSGGGMYNSYSSPTVTNCKFSDNYAYDDGGGMYNDVSLPTVKNCTFSSNSTSGGGGGMFNSSSSPKVTNCTFSGNLAGYGGGMYNTNISNPTVTNCILWEDSGKEIYNLDSTPTVTYCDVQGGYEGTGNIDADPKFTNPDAGDFTLQYNSPCIDAGKNPYAYDETINHDLGWKEDMGAYEYSGVRVSKSVSGIGEILFGGQVRAKVNVTILGTLSAIGITVHPGETHPDAPASVRRWFSVTATGEESVFDLTLSYKDSELNGETEENLNLWRWTGEAWEGPKTPARNPGDNYLLIDSQTAFSDWVIAEALEQRLPGDVSGNGSITAYDASLVLQYIVGLRELSDEDIDAADVTGNGTVTALDAALILQYTVGLITQFPVESKTGAPTLEATSEESALSKTIAQLEATPLNEEQKQVLEQLKRLVSQKLIPARTALFQNYPNPFNPETWLPYQLATDAPVTIRIYNTKGQLIRIINLSNQKAGIYLTKDRAAYWDGNNAKGEAVSSGVYFYQLQAGDFFATRKMVIVK